MSSIGERNVFSTVGASNHSTKEREQNDYYATDPVALELLLQKEQFSKNIWECACGEGHLSRVLEKNGYHTYSTDLVNRGYGIGGVDFLAVNQKFDGDIVTNPPYKYAKEFVEHAIDLVEDGHKVAMLMRLLFLEGKSRRELFEKYPPKYVYVSSARINCAKNADFTNEGSAVAYAWFIWQKGYNGETIVKWFN